LQQNGFSTIVAAIPFAAEWVSTIVAVILFAVEQVSILGAACSLEALVPQVTLTAPSSLSVTFFPFALERVSMVTTTSASGPMVLPGGVVTTSSSFTPDVRLLFCSLSKLLIKCRFRTYVFLLI
jgi:hypothetical protein